MRINEERLVPLVGERAREDLALGRMMVIWQHGEAAKADPVLLNMQARIAAELGRLSPDAAAKGRALFERLTGG